MPYIAPGESLHLEPAMSSDAFGSNQSALAAATQVTAPIELTRNLVTWLAPRGQWCFDQRQAESWPQQQSATVSARRHIAEDQAPKRGTRSAAQWRHLNRRLWSGHLVEAQSNEHPQVAAPICRGKTGVGRKVTTSDDGKCKIGRRYGPAFRAGCLQRARLARS